MNILIITSGTIGSGKSSLTTLLSQELGTEAFYESVDNNPVLPLFYSDPEQYAFLLQIFFLNTRFASIKKALKDDNNVLDRSIYEDSLFFHMNAEMGRATQTEVEVYDKLLETMLNEIQLAAPKKAPDLLVHIEVSLETMLKRIEKRGRDYEQLSHDETLYNYYAELNGRYVKWFEDYDYSPKIKIDGDRYDFMENAEDRAAVLEQIKGKLQELGRI
ncbi:deoxynucleoside kinase [Enterococcus timonensis]|uniref:deoxynucleoside kinase n=1 Tax=Enterococcus timonensis TaxID=1852364 RepID=UPI0008D8EE4E|nr:deoxynucleoside kinase [Enterococcus timonensis]